MVGKAFFGNIAESLNPVFIKEMRQYFQNRRMLVFMGGLLVAQFICTLFFSSAMRFDADNASGVWFFLIILFAGAILSILVCALGAEQRFAEERSDKELNYAMLTTLNPASILWGKLAGAMVMILCIYSMLLPFLTAAYFMRGLSAASLMLTLYIFPILVLNVLAGIFAGSFGQKWITVLYLVGIFNFGIGTVPFLLEIAEDLMDSNVLEPSFWIALLIEYEVAFLVGTLLFLLALAIISPPKSNRFFAAKLYLFLLPFLSLILMAPFYFPFVGTECPPEVFYVAEFMFCAFSVIVLAVISLFELATNSIRVYMQCPRNSFRRVWHFLFSSGFSGSIILTFPILAIPLVLIPLVSSSSGVDSVEIACGFLCILTSFLGYVILSLILSWQTRLPLPAWLWTIIFVFVGNVAPWIPLVINDGEPLSLPMRIPSMVVSQTYCFFEIVDHPLHTCIPALLMSAVITGILFLILLPTIFKAFRLHRHPDIEVKPPTKEMLGK
jgi:hypothetical protein